ncbi:MAG: HAMP domain-containing sensor histidine kinase [Stagnimonas sp.]|nr:HAMP domain-containing sensor histidine kinase [Stagnimonas sp.]
MTGMVTAGCLLAAAPLLMALVWSATVLHRFGERSENLANEGLVMAALSAELRNDIENLERRLRQYGVLREPELADVVIGRLRQSERTLAALARASTEARFETGLLAARTQLDSVRRGWQAADSDTDLESVVAQVMLLGEQARALSELGRELMEAQLAQLRTAAAATQRVILLAVLALIPLTAGLAYGFSLLITRPLRRMNHAISALGHSRYEEPVEIAYPHEMHRLGQRLDWLRQRLSALELDQDRFLRHVSHELKTPLASLQEGCSLMLEGRLGTLGPKQAEVARILAESTSELAGLIGNLLAYSEWQRGQRSPDISCIDARGLLDEVCQAQQLSLRRRHLQLQVELGLEQIGGQHSALKAATENLLSNAIKHAPEHSRIELDLRRCGDYCELSVRDYGRGVPEHERERIFEPFVRGAESEEAGIRGTGVGLSIVREAVRAHGGTVEVEDAQPGARFRMRWPLAVRD